MLRAARSSHCRLQDTLYPGFSGRESKFTKMGDKDKDKSKNHFQKLKLCSHLDELAHHGSVTGDEDDPCASSWILDDESPRECSNMNSFRRFLERIVTKKKTTCG